jgi:transcriptional regulator with XRE-family HTH domain
MRETATGGSACSLADAPKNVDMACPRNRACGNFIYMTIRIPTPEGAVLRFFRFSKGFSEEGFALLAGVTSHTVGRWENGEIPLSRERLAELLALIKVTPEAMDEALLAHWLGNLPDEPNAVPLPEPERRLLDRAAAAGARAGAETARRELALDRLRQRAARHHAWVDAEWQRLRKLPAQRQATVIRALQGSERSWALAVRICDASEAAAGHSADEALRLARLAVRLAGKVPGTEAWRLLLLGHCEPFVANALRVGGHLDTAGETFARADELWQRGEGGDPAGLLDATRRLDLKASHLRQLGQFAKALLLLDQALAGSPPEARARLLLKKATTYTRAGAYELALEALGQAESRLLASECEPRLLCVLQFNRAVNYCHLDRYEDAERLLPLVQALAAALHTELDGIRTRWLTGRTWAGLGRREEAVTALSQVRQAFLKRKIAYDFALVSVELATLYLEQGRTRLVRGIAEEMLWIFQGQKVHQEALAALALFRQAAEAEEVEAEWARSLIKYLYRAQYNPFLRFEP